MRFLHNLQGLYESLGFIILSNLVVFISKHNKAINNLRMDAFSANFSMTLAAKLLKVSKKLK